MAADVSFFLTWSSEVRHFVANSSDFGRGIAPIVRCTSSRLSVLLELIGFSRLPFELRFALVERGFDIELY